MAHLQIDHPDVTKARLLASARSIPGAWSGLRIAALLLVLEGQRPSWIAEVLGLTRMSLHRWVRALNGHGLVALQARPRTGRPPRLTPPLARTLEAQLDQSPQAFGLPRVRWDGPTLAVHVRRQFGVKLQVRQAQNWLHQLGYRLKRASHAYLQARADEARRFRRALKKTGDPGAR